MVISNSTHCSICNVDTNTQTQYQIHIQGQKHLKMIHKHETETHLQTEFSANIIKSNNDGSYKCIPCNLVCSGIIPIRQHITGKTHQKRALQQAQN